MTNTNVAHDEQPEDSFSTRAIHVGSTPDPVTGAVIPPLSLSTTYAQAGVGTAKVSTNATHAGGLDEGD